MGAATKILIIDDDPFVTLSTQMILERSGFQVLTSEGIDCLELVARENPDLILLDLHMPGIRGEEAARRLMSQRPAFGGLIVFHSAEEPDELRRIAQEAGVDGFITKSSSVRELKSQVEKVLGPRAAAGAVSPSEVPAVASSPRPRVLVLEADPIRREALVIGLAGAGATATGLSGPFCVNAIALEDPHLVVIGRTVPDIPAGRLMALIAAVPGLSRPRLLPVGEWDQDPERQARRLLDQLGEAEGTR